MMDAGIKEMLLTIKLNERNTQYLLKKETGLNSFDLDMLLYARKKQVLNVYEIRKYFPHTNIQQIRRSVSKLHKNTFLELLRPGKKRNPALYWTSKKGEIVISTYEKLLIELLITG